VWTYQSGGDLLAAVFEQNGTAWLDVKLLERGVLIAHFLVIVPDLEPRYGLNLVWQSVEQLLVQVSEFEVWPHLDGGEGLVLVEEVSNEDVVKSGSLVVHFN